MFENKTICCFSGHRPEGLPAAGVETSAEMIGLKLLLYHTIEDAAQHGVTDFYAGGAKGFDTIAAEAVLAMQTIKSGVRLHLALPSMTQAKGWGSKDRIRYDAIVSAATSVWYASEKDNFAPSLLARNRYMVDHADCAIVYLNKSAGGTLRTVAYAQQKGIPYINLAEHI